METLQDILDDTIKGLNKLLLKTHDPDKETAIRNQRDACFKSWEALIQKNLDDTLPEVNAAIGALKAAQLAIKNAQNDLKKIADVIAKVGVAAQAVDKIANAVIKYVV